MPDPQVTTLHPKSDISVRTWTAVATVIAALVAIPAALVAGWEVAHGVATMVMHALGAHR